VKSVLRRRMRGRIPARIREKLAWWFVGTLALQLSVLALIVMAMMHRNLVSQVDRLLDMDARAVMEAVLAGQEVSARRGVPGVGAGLLGSELLTSDAQALLWVEADHDSPILMSMTPGAPSLPKPNFFDMQLRDKVTAADGETYYLRSVEMAGDGRARYLLQLVRPAELVTVPLTNLAKMLALGFGVAMVLGWFGGQAIAGAAMSPISDIVRATRAIRISRLGRRLRETGPNDELLELTKVINDLLQRFQDGLDRERNFASDVSHELRTPLAAQSVIAQAVLRNHSAGINEYRTALRHVLDESRHMEQFIERLLALARISTQPLAMALESVDVHDAVHQTAASLQLLSEDKGHTLHVDCPSNLQVRGESTMLRQALMNVVHNAIDHCAPGTHIVVRARADGPRVVIEVEDNGAGIAPQTRSRLFHRFHRGATRGLHAKGGLGLGLSIVKALMEAQGGTVHLDGNHRSGAKFCLILPVVPLCQGPTPSVLDATESLPPPTPSAAGGTQPLFTGPLTASAAVEKGRASKRGTHGQVSVRSSS
jgi:signal transduction histidine kinase